MISRSSGVLLHISSLPSAYGCGDFGPAAYTFVDFLAAARQRFWQVLPLNPTVPVYDNSPYSSMSAFAANRLYISPEGLRDAGWLQADDFRTVPEFSSTEVDYEKVAAYKETMLQSAFTRFRDTAASDASFKQFCQDNAFWLDDYALFLVFKTIHQDKPWTEWAPAFRDRDPAALANGQKDHHDELQYIKFVQFVAYRQWESLRRYAGEKNVKLIGDIPIYVNHDGADVWSHREIFKLDDKGLPTVVAGVPPDYFSKTGQRWGNPVYNWERAQTSGFSWWMNRMRCNFKLYDYVRIDHFRGLIGYWEVPVSEKTAVNGHWADGPGNAFFDTIKRTFDKLPIIAEDLGTITPDVTEAMQRYKFPGMKVLLFAFNGNLDDHPYIPENYEENAVVYTGTHDNNTARGWFVKEATTGEKQNLNRYLNKDITAANVAWELIALAMRSRASLAVIPLQDALGLGADARMNVPGTNQGNWRWRVRSEELTAKVSQRLAKCVASSQRGISG